MRHLKTNHRTIFDELKKLKTKTKARNFAKIIKVELNIETIYAGFVELVSKNGRPFCISEDSGMRVIIDPILEGVYKQTGERHTINRIVLEKKVQDAYFIVVDRIKREIQNNPVMVMLDITTKHNRAILGVNVKFFSDGRFIIRTLSMRELNKSHSAANIHEMLTETLAIFEIDVNQIYAYISDNAPNVINVADLLNEDCDHNLQDDDEMFSFVNNRIFTNLLAETYEQFSREHSAVNFVPCAAHTVQLAIKDVLHETIFASNIQFVKSVVKELRIPTIARLLREKNLKQAILDHEIRWSYKYMMVKRMLELRDFIDELGANNEKLRVTQHQWNEIQILEQVLLEPYKLTMEVQKDDCTMSDFYGAWLQSKQNLQKIGHEMANYLVESMINREQSIIGHQVMYACVYLDPRFNFLLTSNQKSVAILHLCQLYTKLRTLNPINAHDETTDNNDDDFENYLNSIVQRTTSNAEIPLLSEPQIMYKINQFQNRPPIHYKTKIIEYWKNVKSEEPQLFELAVVLLGVPVAQVSVERSFSSLTYIFNNYRSRLSPDVLNEVLLLRLNFELAPLPHEYVGIEDFEDEDAMSVALSS